MLIYKDKSVEVSREADHFRQLFKQDKKFLRQIKVIQKAEAEQRNKPKQKLIDSLG